MDVKAVQTSWSAQGDPTLSTDSEKTLVPVTRVIATFLLAAFVVSALGELALATVTPDTIHTTDSGSLNLGHVKFR